MIIKKAIFKCDGTQEFVNIEVPDDFFEDTAENDAAENSTAQSDK